MSEEPGFFDAYAEVITPLEQARKLLALVSGAEASGLLAVLREGVPTGELAGRCGLAPDLADALVAALRANGVVVDDGAAVRLRPAWRAVTGRAAYVDLASVLRGTEVEARLLASIAGGDSYWTMSVQDRLDIARAVSPDPYRQELVAAVRATADSSPVRSRLARGGRLLEAGCGVAGQLLTCLQAFPRLVAVGVELTADLAEEAERRAHELRVADRFTVLHGDVADVDLGDLEPFDFAHWSQYFFPAASRLPALRAVHRVVRPGGFAYAPLPFPFEEMAREPEGAAAREYSLFRVVLSSWGVPERDEAGLAEEMLAGGFTDPRLVRAPDDVPRVLADRP